MRASIWDGLKTKALPSFIVNVEWVFEHWVLFRPQANVLDDASQAVKLRDVDAFTVTLVSPDSGFMSVSLDVPSVQYWAHSADAQD